MTPITRAQTWQTRPYEDVRARIVTMDDDETDLLVGWLLGLYPGVCRSLLDRLDGHAGRQLTGQMSLSGFGSDPE